MTDSEIAKAINLFIACMTVLLLAVIAAVAMASSRMEDCAKSCGTGRFKSWTERLHTTTTAQPDLPEKCECVSTERP